MLLMSSPALPALPSTAEAAAHLDPAEVGEDPRPRAIVELHDNCTRPEFVDALREWTVVYLRYDGCRADGTETGGVAQAGVAQRRGGRGVAGGGL